MFKTEEDIKEFEKKTQTKVLNYKDFWLLSGRKINDKAINDIDIWTDVITSKADLNNYISSKRVEDIYIERLNRLFDTYSEYIGKRLFLIDNPFDYWIFTFSGIGFDKNGDIFILIDDVEYLDGKYEVKSYFKEQGIDL